MSLDPNKLQQELLRLSPEKQQLIINLIYMFNDEKSDKKKELKFEWAGCLKDFKNQFTSVELQKKALEWRD